MLYRTISAHKKRCPPLQEIEMIFSLPPKKKTFASGKLSWLKKSSCIFATCASDESKWLQPFETLLVINRDDCIFSKVFLAINRDGWKKPRHFCSEREKSIFLIFGRKKKLKIGKYREFHSEQLLHMELLLKMSSYSSRNQIMFWYQFFQVMLF